MELDSYLALPELSKWHRSRMLNAASQVLTAQQAMMGKNGKNILHYTLQKKRKHIRFTHYPKGDRIDFDTGAQYFYHSHRENLESEEHGHFHCFMRTKHINKRIKPVYPSDLSDPNLGHMTHLVAIAMNRFGQPIRLFTVNQWISTDIFFKAKHADYFLRRFHMTLKDDPYWQVLDQWIEGMLHIFSPQIAWLHHERDYFLEKNKQNDSEYNVYLDENIEECSEIDIDLTKQIQWIIGAN